MSQSSNDRYGWIYTQLQVKIGHRCHFCKAKVHQEPQDDCEHLILRFGYPSHLSGTNNCGFASKN